MNGSISVVVPVYHGAKTLPALVERLGNVLHEVVGDTKRYYEVILVNDGSRDASWQVISQLAEQYPFVRGIDLGRNYGQHNALLCGIRAVCIQTNEDVIVTMDDDLQHLPETIPSLLPELEAGYDVVYATPKQEQHDLWRNVASQVTKWALQGAMGVDTARKISAFRLFRARLRDAFEAYRGPLVNIDVLLTWGTTRFKAMEVRHDARQVGASNYTFRKLMGHTLNMLTGFTVLPLQVATMLGITTALFGLIVLLFVVGRYALFGGSVAGFPFLASTIAIFAGATLLALGVIGEYLARMHLRLLDRPAYVVRETTTHRNED